MAYFINPVEAERCVFLSCEGEMPPSELAAARYEAHGLKRSDLGSATTRVRFNFDSHFTPER
jgi:hypothetical protein